VIGLLFLGICLLASDALARQEHGTLFNLARESLTIAGWVAMWRPMQIFLYDWWPLLNMGRLYEKLSKTPVEVVQRRASEASRTGSSSASRTGSST
jgi:hypothetical protein